MSRRPQDHWGRKAKQEGFAARSVFKLEDIDRRVRLLRPGMRVLDLGAFPGSWTSYAAQRVGAQGKVLGIDLTEFRGVLPPWASIRQGDALTLDVIEAHGPRSFEVVLSDMAPNTTGHRFTDQARSHDLFMRALTIARGVIAPHGHFVGKIFQGPEFDEARKGVHETFEEVRIIKPPASRSESIETFLIGLRARAPQSEREVESAD